MSLTHIETIELGSSQSSITFSSIPQDYDDLIVFHSARTDRNGGADYLLIEFNAAGSTNNSVVYLNGNGTSVSSLTSPNNFAGYTSDNLNTSNTYGNASLYVSNYTGSTAKSYMSDSVSETNGTTAFQGISANLWDDTSAITSVKLVVGIGTNIVAGSTFSLYGVTAGGDGTVTTS